MVAILSWHVSVCIGHRHRSCPRRTCQFSASHLLKKKWIESKDQSANLGTKVSVFVFQDKSAKYNFQKDKPRTLWTTFRLYDRVHCKEWVFDLWLEWVLLSFIMNSSPQRERVQNIEYENTCFAFLNTGWPGGQCKVYIILKSKSCTYSTVLKWLWIVNAEDWAGPICVAWCKFLSIHWAQCRMCK